MNGSAAPVPPSHEEAIRNGRLILVAEDNPTNQDLIALQLAILGFASDVVGDGQLALERWQSGQYALLLSDLQMPTMDGHALTSRIRAQERDSAHIPIVGLSADPSSSEADYCRANGMDDYLSKPVPLAQLKATLERWLRGTAPDAQQPTTGTTVGSDAIGAVDIAVLTSMIGSEPAVVRDFVHAFRVGAAAIALKLAAACQQSDAPQARLQAHKLMSSARSIGARRLGDLCARMATAGKAGDTQALAILLPLFEQEFEAVNVRLDELQA